MGLSASHLLLVLMIVFILFGAGRLPQVMRDLAKGYREFRRGLEDDVPHDKDHQ